MHWFFIKSQVELELPPWSAPIIARLHIYFSVTMTRLSSINDFVNKCPFDIVYNAHGMCCLMINLLISRDECLIVPRPKMAKSYWTWHLTHMSITEGGICHLQAPKNKQPPLTHKCSTIPCQSKFTQADQQETESLVPFIPNQGKNMWDGQDQGYFIPKDENTIQTGGQQQTMQI